MIVVYRLVLLAMLLGLSLPVGAETDNPVQPQATIGNLRPGPRVGLLWWPAAPANAANPFIRSLEECLVDRLTQTCPQMQLVMPTTIRDALFPLLEPATQPETEEAFAALLARSEVRPRLAKRMDYLVAFAGGTTEENRGGILCGVSIGGGGCLGLAWINKDTRIRVVIWDLSQPAAAAHPASRVEGTTWIPAFGLPIPIPATTETAACRDISWQLVEFIDPEPRAHCRRGAPPVDQ